MCMCFLICRMSGTFISAKHPSMHCRDFTRMLEDVFVSFPFDTPMLKKPSSCCGTCKTICPEDNVLGDSKRSIIVLTFIVPTSLQIQA